MKYENVTPALFIDRPNRFIANVSIDGTTETVHVKNTGRCKELLLPGTEVFITEPHSKGRKTRYDLIAVRKYNGLLINIDSQAPNKVVSEWLCTQRFTKVVPEYTYSNSRIDFYMERSFGNTTEKYLMEVKGCTLERDGIGYFPDAPTKRGTKHLRELIKAAQKGYHAYCAFVIQMDSITEVRPNTETDPDFAEAFAEAKRSGVHILFLPCHVESDSLKIISKTAGLDAEKGIELKKD